MFLKKALTELAPAVEESVRTTQGELGMHLRNALSLGIAAGVLAAITISPASAQVLTIMVTDNLGHSLTVADGGAGDSNTAAGAVSIDTALLAAFPNLIGQSNITAAFNQPGGTQSRLTSTGDLFGNTASTIAVVASINNVVIPAGAFRQFNSTNTISFNNTPMGTSGTDTNGVSTTNTLFTKNLTDTPFTYSSTGTAPNAGAGTGPGFVFANTGAFAITTNTTIMVVNNGESQYTTNSIVNAAGVPEPGAFAMFACFGVTGSLFAFRRVRRNRK